MKLSTKQASGGDEPHEWRSDGGKYPSKFRKGDDCYNRILSNEGGVVYTHYTRARRIVGFYYIDKTSGSKKPFNRLSDAMEMYIKNGNDEG
jgi:hypothetical protein